MENQPGRPGPSFADYRDGMGLSVKLRRFLLKQSFETISRRQGFHLLTDFFHLNETITLYGDGSQTRSFCYVDDMVEAFILAGAAHDSICTPKRPCL